MRAPAPGAALLHPLMLVALLLLVLNDHVLKRVCPGMLTGKLSDFAGVLLLPVVLHAAIELAAARVRRPLHAAASRRVLLGCIALASLAFAMPEVWAPADFVYRYGLALAQWPVHALAALLGARDLPGLIPVRATPDVTDLLALPMGFVAFRVGRIPPAQPRKSEAEARCGCPGATGLHACSRLL